MLEFSTVFLAIFILSFEFGGEKINYFKKCMKNYTSFKKIPLNFGIKKTVPFKINITNIEVVVSLFLNFGM